MRPELLLARVGCLMSMARVLAWQRRVGTEMGNNQGTRVEALSTQGVNISTIDF